MESNKVNLKIYGHEYIVSGEKPREHIIKVADYVDTKMYEIAQLVKGSNVSDLAVLSAVNITDELLDMTDRLEVQQRLVTRMESDVKHYIQLWEEAKKSFSKYQEDAANASRQKEEMSKIIREKDDEILVLKRMISEEAEKITADSAEEINKLKERCREIESSFFDLQMENIQLKSELEKEKQRKEDF